MKKIVSYLRTFYEQEFRAGYFAALSLFLGACIAFNYYHDFEDTVLDGFLYQPLHVPLMFLFFGVAYFGTICLYCLFYRRTDFLRKRGFWLTSFFALAVLAVNATFYYPNLYYAEIFEPNTYYFARKCSNNLVSEFIYLIPGALFWYYRDREREPLYGFRTSQVNLRPYLTMLLLMAPLVLWASFQPDFQEDYPRYHPHHDTSEMYYTHLGIFEIFYGLDFIGVEFFFRGFMVMALARYLGPGAIMPMVTVYAFLHFGKPLGETIGSVFGGTILGIIAYYSRSIWGGIIIHMGVAYLMELTALLQHLFQTST